MKITKRSKNNIDKNTIPYIVGGVWKDKSGTGISFNIADLYAMTILDDDKVGYNVIITPLSILECESLSLPKMNVFYPIEDNKQCVVQCDEVSTRNFIDHLCKIDNVSIEDKEQKRKAYKICKGLVAISDLMEELIEDYRRYSIKGEPVE